MKSKSPDKQKVSNSGNINGNTINPSEFESEFNHFADTYDTYMDKINPKNNNKKKGRITKGSNRGSGNLHQHNNQEEKEFENKTFFSTELNMIGKKKSSNSK